MPITYNQEKKLFKLDTVTSSYILQVFEEGYLIHLYYGARIPDDNLTELRIVAFDHSAFEPNNARVKSWEFSPTISPLEYPASGTGDFRIPAFTVKAPEGNTATDLRYLTHRILKGKKPLEGIPALYVNSDDEADTLEVDLIDRLTGVVVTVSYTVFNNTGAMTRSAYVRNTGKAPVELKTVMSASVELNGADFRMIHLWGRYGKERTYTEQPLHHGIQGFESRRGSSSHEYNPFAAFAKNNASEDYGEVYGFNLVWSGSFSFEAQADSYDNTRVNVGINYKDFSWLLKPGEGFQAPEVVMVYTTEGIGEMSRIYHRLYNKNLIRGEWRDKVRPVLINSWEAAYFNFDDDKLVAFAERAKKLGIEMLVMDDGWFGHRNDDHTSLGDWYVNEKKLKGGLSSLISRVKALGLKFGIWYEPEMISEDSDLYRAHPDWCLHIKGREQSNCRNQYVLDMTRKEVRDNIFDQMYKVLSENDIDYLKWDFNRNLTEVGSEGLPPERQTEIYHRFVLGTYDLMDRITKAFPHILLENCSGGGGRYDPAMLYFSPQIWASDNTDPIERLTIQFGTSLCYPASSMGAHVSASTRASYETKGNVALWGSFGYELDPLKLSEETCDLIRRQIAEYHKYYDLIHKGDLYRIETPTENPCRCAWEFVSPDKSEMLFTFVIIRIVNNPKYMPRFKGLDPNRYYREETSGEIYSGALLMNAGYNMVNFSRPDGASYKLHFVAVD